MTKVILVRHGQTQWNLDMKYQGHCDIELTEKGVEQAMLAAQRLAGENISALYASDLSRALKTAECIGAKHNLPVTAVPELREINFGEWEGLTFESINSQSKDERSKLFTHPDEIIIPGGETFRQVKERAINAITKLVAQHPDQTIVIVSHGATIRTVLCAVLNIHLNHLWKIKQDNTAINVLEYYDENVMVSLVNDAQHLNGTLL
ncbi:histidine phosphatase family protein [Pelosinus sp. sgz500959]|uniref:histidine phosphatase family protein n=1 Tax=Pelosinus sp. sgz500959 TaxID=3242472 RepID=UPI00366A9A83